MLGVLGLVVSPSSERDERRPEPRLPWHAWPWAWPWPWGHTTTLLLLLLVPARAGLGPAGDLHVGESSSSPSSPSTLSDGHDELRRLSPRPLCNAQEISLVEGRHNRGNGGWLCPLHPPPHTHTRKSPYPTPTLWPGHSPPADSNAGNAISKNVKKIMGHQAYHLGRKNRFGNYANNLDIKASLRNPEIVRRL